MMDKQACYRSPFKNKNVFYDLSDPSISIHQPGDYSMSNCDLFGEDNMFIPFQNEGSMKSYFKQVLINDTYIMKCIKEEKLTSMYSVVKSLNSFGVFDLNSSLYKHYKKEVAKQNKALKSFYRAPEKRSIIKPLKLNFKEQIHDTIVEQYGVKNNERKYNVEILQKSIIDQHKLLIHVLKRLILGYMMYS